jgi:predicted permease
MLMFVQAVRSIRRAPWYFATATIVLTIGVGLVTTVFAVVDGVLFKPLPYPHVEELFGVAPGRTRESTHPQRLRPVAQAHVQAWREAVPGARFAIYNADGFDIPLGGEPVELAQVDEHFMEVVGVPVLIGGFRLADFQPSASSDRVALITHDLWIQRFGGDPSVVGRTFTNQVTPGETPSSTQIVGVLDPTFMFPTGLGRVRPQVLWAIPREPDGGPPSLGRAWLVLARIPKTLPVADVERRLDDATRAVARLDPPPPPGRPSMSYDIARLLPIRRALTSTTRSSFLVIFLTSACLLLLACINLAGLAAARMVDRRREMALRRALGARTSDLAALMAAETALVVLPAIASGIVLAYALLDVVRHLLPGYALLKPLTIDTRVIVASVAAGIACLSLVTAWALRSTRRAPLRPMLGSGGSARRSMAERVLIAAQVGIALALVLAGCLFVASVAKAWQEDPGVATDGGFRIELTSTQAGPQPIAQINELMRAIRRVPGVIGAGGLEHAFLQQMFNGSIFDAPAGANEPNAPTPLGVAAVVESMQVTAGFFQAAGLTALEGRLPTDEEFEGGAPVLAIGRRVAERYWPGRSALGQTLARDGKPYVVVGVVRDVRFRSLDVESGGEIYCSIAADPRAFLWNLYVRVTPGHERAIGTVIDVITTHTRTYRIAHVQTARQSYAEGIRGRRFSAWVFGVFAGAALVIAGVGILGLLAMSTVRRTREFGIRTALGAVPSCIVRLVLREQMTPLIFGMLAGLTASYWFVQSVRGSLYGFGGYEAEIWILAIAVVLLVGTCGALIPAIHASRADPLKALRIE